MGDIEARELELFIENDSELYSQQYKPINRNLALKWYKGIYDHVKAVKLFMYLAESGAKKYVEEVAPNTPWFEMFDVSTRKKAAESLTNTFESYASDGQFSEYKTKKMLKEEQVRAHSRSA
jgi:hypothetical protein